MFAELMPYNRSWYALRRESGWLLGPSKYIGYQNLSPEEYLGSPYSAERHGRVVQRDKSGMPLDGRVTEGVLQRWSELAEDGHPDYESLHCALNALCARYGKKPNSLARISIIKEGRQAKRSPGSSAFQSGTASRPIASGVSARRSASGNTERL